MEENLKLMEKFFKYDMEVKKILTELVPSETDRYNQDYLISYVDRLFEALKYIESDIGFMIDNFELFQVDKSYFKNYIEILKSKIIDCGYDYDKLKKLYEVCFTNMDEKFIDKVYTNCHGFGGCGISLSEATSINEILHVIHQTIINNEQNYRNLPVLSSGVNDYGTTSVLYGKYSDMAMNIYQELSKNLQQGDTDIMSLSDDKVIIMARDLGHALLVDVTKKNNQYYVDYYIPKVCNPKMVNELKGVRKVDEMSRYTTGQFNADISCLPQELSSFMSKVPTDDDMFKEGGPFYNPDRIGYRM